MNNTSTFYKNVRVRKLLVLALSTTLFVQIFYSIIPNQFLLCAVMVLATFIMGDREIRSGISVGLLALTTMWTIDSSTLTLFQERVFPSELWITQIMHLSCGISVIGLTEILVARKKEAGVKSTKLITIENV